MEIKKPQRVETPQWITDMVQELTPLLTRSTRFVRVTENTQAFGKSLRDGEACIQIQNAVSAKTVFFQTDGKYKDEPGAAFADGSFVHRHVTDWNYIIVENVIAGADGKTKSVKICYTKAAALHAGLRQSIGLTGY